MAVTKCFLVSYRPSLTTSILPLQMAHETYPVSLTLLFLGSVGQPCLDTVKQINKGAT